MTTETLTEAEESANDFATPVEEETAAPATAFDKAVLDADAIVNALLARVGDVATADPFLKIYIYGAPGAGKSTWTATAPDFLAYDVERGMKVLKGHKDKITGVGDVMEFSSTTQAKLLVQYMKEGHSGFDKYKTLIIDSGSELQAKYNKELITAATIADPSWDPTVMPDNGWNQSTQFMKSFFDELRGLNRHVIVTGHAREDEDKTTGRRLIRPNLTPKVVEAMAGIFDAVVYLERIEEPDGSVVRNLRVDPVTKPINIMAKNRIPALQESVYADSTFDTLLSAYLSQ